MTDPTRQAIASRIKFARKLKFHRAIDAIEELEQRYGKKRSSYYSHESGARLPDDEDIGRYAELFGVTPEFIRYGSGSEVYKGTATAINEDESEASVVAINQYRRQSDLKSSHIHPVRLIIILSAEQIRTLSAGGDLATMSGSTLPVPDFLAASPDSFAYLIPSHDFSMVAASGPSYAPGACVVIDPQRQIAPGDRVYADIEGFDEPVVRKFVAARPFTTGLKFRLEAFNPAFDPIELSDPQEIRVLARVIWVAQEQ